MKRVKLYWTPFALKCLDQIEEYICLATFSSKISSGYIKKLVSRVEQLQYLPDSGQIEELLRHTNQNIRYLIEGNYKIIYQHIDGVVIITDVFHVKQNPLKIKKRNKH